MSSKNCTVLTRGVCLLVISLVGCGKSDSIVPVNGVLTFKGKPVTNAWIDFMPEGGRMSSGQTDDQGHFKLTYDSKKPVAMIGKHKVLLRPRPVTVAEQEAVMRGQKQPMPKELADMFDKYSPAKSKKEVVVETNSKEPKIDLD
jgi:hypothetical protein